MNTLRILAVFVPLHLSIIAHANPLVGSLTQNGDAAFVKSNDPTFNQITSDWSSVYAVSRINNGAWIYGAMTGDFADKNYSSWPGVNLYPYLWEAHWGNWDGNPNHNGPMPFTLNFKSTSVLSAIATSNTFLHEGLGVIEMEGFDPTIVSWKISAHQTFYGGAWASVTYTANGQAVPEGGLTIAMIGGVLFGLISLRRRFVKTSGNRVRLCGLG